MIVILSATCRRESRRRKWRALPSHRRIWLESVASEGKPTFKTQPNVLHFYIFKYHVFTIMYLLFMYYYIRGGIIVVVVGQSSTYPIPFRNFRVRTTLVDMCIATSLLPFNVYLFVSRYCWIEAAPTDLTHTLMRDRLPRLTYGLYHISGLGGVRFSNFSGAAFTIGRAPKGV